MNANHRRTPRVVLLVSSLTLLPLSARAQDDAAALLLPPPLDAAPGTAGTPTPPGLVRLHVNSPVPVEIQSHSYLYGTLNGHSLVLDRPTPVCLSPCDILLDGSHGQDFSASAPNVNGSPRFRLTGGMGDQQLDVFPGSPRLRTGGTVAMALGSIAIGLGLLGTVGGAVNQDQPAVYTPSGVVLQRAVVGSGGAIEAAGIVLLSVGGTAVIGGLVALHQSQTKIQLRPAGASGELRKPGKPRYWAGEF